MIIIFGLPATFRDVAETQKKDPLSGTDGSQWGSWASALPLFGYCRMCDFYFIFLLLILIYVFFFFIPIYWVLSLKSLDQLALLILIWWYTELPLSVVWALTLTRICTFVCYTGLEWDEYVVVQQDQAHHGECNCQRSGSQCHHSKKVHSFSSWICGSGSISFLISFVCGCLFIHKFPSYRSISAWWNVWVFFEKLKSVLTFDLILCFSAWLHDWQHKHVSVDCLQPGSS